jgi:hypothetical protein
VEGEEDVENDFARDFVLVEKHFGNLCMVGGSGAHGFVTRVVDLSTHVTAHYVGYALELHVGAV